MAVTGDQEHHERFFVTLLNGDKEAARDVIQQLANSHVHPVEVYEELLCPALFRIGKLWCDGEITVADEHRATQIALELISSLRTARDFQPTVECSVVVASVENEEHYLGAMMVAHAFRFEGWRVDFLGPNVPTSDLIKILHEGGVQLLALSISQEPNLDQLQRLMKKPALNTKVAAKIIAGGKAVEAKKPWAESLGVEVAANPLEGVKKAKELLGADLFRVDLSRLLKELGDRIRKLRKQRGITQQQLAEKARMDRTYVVAVELGKTNLTIGVLSRFAEALEVSIESILLGIARATPTQSRQDS